MKILITGGCGFLGSNVAASYLDDGAQVVVLDALFRPGGERNLAWLQSGNRPGELRFHKIDTADSQAVEEAFRMEGPFDFICHFAGQVAMTKSLEDPRRDFLTNVAGTFNILEAMRKHSPAAFLAYSSTNKVYGELKNFTYQETPTRFVVPSLPNGFDESAPLDFAGPYGCSKGAADQYVRDWHRNYGLATVVFRHSAIYGGRQFATFDQGWVGWFCRQALIQGEAYRKNTTPEPFTIAGTGKQVRDVLHAADLVRLYRSAFTHREHAAGRIFNIGGSLANSLSLLELFALIERLLDLPKPLVYTRVERRPSDQDFFVADIEAAKLALSWRPEVTVEVGVRQMLDWQRAAMEDSTISD